MADTIQIQVFLAVSPEGAFIAGDNIEDLVDNFPGEVGGVPTFYELQLTLPRPGPVVVTGEVSGPGSYIMKLVKG